MNKTTAIILALVTTTAAASANTREAWSGMLQQKSFDQLGRKTKSAITITAGLMGLKDSFVQGSFNPPQPNGMEPLSDDVYAYGIVLFWWKDGKRMGYRWQVTYAGAFTREEIKREDLNMPPIGISWFSGLMVTEEDRNKTIGGFALEVENRSAMTITATVTADWQANEILMAHRTTHGGTLPPGSFRSIACVPERDEWAMATGEPIVEVK